MRIAFIGQKGIPVVGGIERHVEALAIRLGAMGHEVTVYTRPRYAPANPSFAPGVQVVSLPTIPTKHLDAIVHTFVCTLHAALVLKPDIIHYQGVGPSLMTWLARLLARRSAVVSTFHCIDANHQKWGWFARLSLRLGERAACTFPHRTIVATQLLSDYAKKHFGREGTKIPNGALTSDVHPGSDRLAEYGIEPGKYIAMVSRLVRHKGAHHLIRAWQLLKARGATNGMKLVICGDSSFTDGYVAEIKALAKDDADIVFTGWARGAVDQVYANAAFCVHPSEAEGLPLVVLEAMGWGKAMLVSDIPEHLEVVGGGMSPTFRNTDVEDLARQIEALIKDPALCAEYGRRGKAHIREHYNWNKIAQATSRVYTEAVDDKHGHADIRSEASAPTGA
jgi:glycosyltransferase involved in cell wall biosynthesis